MTNRQLYRVLFKGVLTGEYDLHETKAHLARLFHLNENMLQKLFSGKEFILKDNLEEHVAFAFGMKIAEAGCECYIEQVPFTDEVPELPARAGGRRTDQRFRRGASPSAPH